MQKLFMIVLSSLLINQTANADCKDALTKAGVVIQKQDELIKLQANRVNELGSENQKLTEQLLQMKDLADQAQSSQITYGAIGIVLGAVAMGLLKK